MNPFAFAAGLCVSIGLSVSAASLERVLNQDGRPVEGAGVTVVLPAEGDRAARIYGRRILSGTTREDGSLTLSIPNLKGAFVLIDHPDYAPEVIPWQGNAPASAIVLSRGRRVKGLVIGDGEVAIKGGTVCAIWRPEEEQLPSSVGVRRCGEISEGGAWMIDNLPEGRLAIEIEVPAYLPLEVGLALSSDWQGPLETGTRVKFNIRLANGRPANDARVECRHSVAVATNKAGIAVASIEGDTRCRASTRDGWISEEILVSESTIQPVTLGLNPGASIVGILMADDGSAVENPSFSLISEFDGGRRTRPIAPAEQKDGEFVLWVRGSQRLSLRIEAPGRLPLLTDWFEPLPGKLIDLGLLTLRRGAGVRGRIVHALTAEPLDGAIVRFEPQGKMAILMGRAGRASSISDAEGLFTISGLPIGSYRVRIDGEDLAPDIRIVDLDEERVRDVGAWALHPGIRLTGTVRGREGKGLPAARLHLLPIRALDEESIVSLEADGQGVLPFVRVAPGKYRAVVFNPGLEWDQEVDIGYDESADLTLEVASTQLRGTVTREGVPVSGGELIIDRMNDRQRQTGVAVARVAGGGEQLWSGKPSPPSIIQVSRDGRFAMNTSAGRMIATYVGQEGTYATRLIDVIDEPEVFVMIELAGFDLNGRLVEAETGLGLGGRVELYTTDGVRLQQLHASTSGEFVFPAVQTGAYSVVGVAEGTAMMEPVRIDVGHEAPPPVEIRMKPSKDAILEVEVLRRGDQAAIGVEVIVIDSAGRQLAALPTRRDGTIGFKGLSAGSVRLILADPLAGVRISDPIALREGEQQTSIHLESGRDIIVRCRGIDCANARLGWFRITDSSGLNLAPFLLRSNAIVLDEQGKAWLGRLAAGTYTVTSSLDGDRMEDEIEVGRGPGEVVVDLNSTRGQVFEIRGHEQGIH